MGRALVELGIEHIISLIAPQNLRSQRVAEKLGERREGRAEVRGHELEIWGADLPLTPDGFGAGARGVQGGHDR